MLALVFYRGKELAFNIRDYAGQDGTNTDRSVIRETIIDNDYQLDEQDLGDAGVVVDIGANIGAFSIQAACLGATKVIAIEPNDDNYALLCENVKLNGFEDIITPIQYAVAVESGKGTLAGSQGGAHLGDKGQEILLITLESALKLANSDQIDILKMDIEGGEYGLFESCPDVCLTKVKHLRVEFHGATKAKFGSMMARLSQFFNIRMFGHFDVMGYIYGQRY